MAGTDFEFLRDFLKSHSGLVITPEKTYLIETRLMPVARRHGVDGISGLVARLREGQDDSLLRDVSEAMNTHESFFFRDNHPFDLFKDKLLPNLLARRAEQKTFRIWCAACSSGQEPYSLAMLMAEAGLHAQGWRPEIIATDISHDILDRAAKGLYTQFEVQRGLPVQFLVKYFTKEDENWRVKTDLRDMVHFRHFNLLDEPRTLGRFDVIFCRNVLIYFDVETKGHVLHRMSTILNDDGVLFLGGAESVFGITERFEAVPKARGIYRQAGKIECLAENESA